MGTPGRNCSLLEAAFSGVIADFAWSACLGILTLPRQSINYLVEKQRLNLQIKCLDWDAQGPEAGPLWATVFRSPHFSAETKQTLWSPWRTESIVWLAEWQGSVSDQSFQLQAERLQGLGRCKEDKQQFASGALGSTTLLHFPVEYNENLTPNHL